jgi:AcrR family transcriptional regulator
MQTQLPPVLQPRKTPSQARSNATVVTIFEATIQVLAADGLERLTTTRVAERAGVSVGTLYQYFPNKQALLAAVLQRHLGGIVDAIEAACAARRGSTVRQMMTALCNAFIDAKTHRIDVSRALHGALGDVGGDVLVRSAAARSQAAIAAMLATARDKAFDDLTTPTLILVTATVGPVQAVLEAGATRPMLEALRTHLIELCVGYLERVALPR